METCGLNCRVMAVHKCRYWKKNYTPLLESIHNINFDTITEDEVLNLVKRLEKEVRREWGNCAVAFFRLPSVINFVVDIGDRFGVNDKILEDVISILHFSSRRSSKTKMSIMYEFMFKHKDKKYKRIEWLIADAIPYFFEFDSYNEKWGYIMAIPKIAPKRQSINIFRRVLEYRLQQIPDDIKPQIINIFDGFIEKFNPYKCDKCKMFALISDLGDTRENTTCQNGNGCFHVRD
jgi:hypothetical protein